MFRQNVIVNIVTKDGVEIPTYAKPGDSGVDVRAYIPTQKSLILKSKGGRALIPTGLFVEMPDGWEIQVRPRSGLAIKHGITVLNTPGTIDSGYRNEIAIILINLSEDDFVINHGDRIAQFVLQSVPLIEFHQVSELNDSIRGLGGFGHTGV